MMDENATQEKNALAWNKRASNILKSELARLGITYEELAKKLNAIGVDETGNTIRLKMHRGTFQFAFFLQCAEAIGLEKLQIK